MILRNKKEGNWLKFFLIIPIILAILFSIKSPLLDYFRFLYLVPIMCLVLAINCDKKWQKILIGGGFLIFSLMYLLNHNYYREDWKGVMADLKNEKSVYMVASFDDPVKFYDSKIEKPAAGKNLRFRRTQWRGKIQFAQCLATRIGVECWKSEKSNNQRSPHDKRTGIIPIKERWIRSGSARVEIHLLVGYATRRIGWVLPRVAQSGKELPVQRLHPPK